jgi:two-component system, NarL family, sensor histidine kinase DesK
MDSTSRLNDLRAEFRATSTQSMPIAGMIYWAIVAVAALYVTPNQLSLIALYGSGMIFPLGVLLDRLAGRKMRRSSTANPLTQLFIQSLGLVVLVWPLILIAARAAHNANLIVLGAAILMGIIWIPYGWAADDPVGLQHAIGRAVLAYSAYRFTPNPYKATAIALTVLLCYLYSLIRQRRPPQEAKSETLAPPSRALVHEPSMSGSDFVAPSQQKNFAWIWLGYTGFLFIQPIMEPSLFLWLGSLTAFAIFLGIFTGYVRAIGPGRAMRFWMIAATFILGLLCFPWNQGASTFFIYAACFLPFSIRSVRRVLELFLVECLLILAEGYFVDSRAHHGIFHIGWPNTGIAIFLVLIIGTGNIFFAQQKRADTKLRMAHDEIEQLAALAERERIARDLHDVLGHTLSVIVLKAELAGRLMERDPRRAASEIADVERTARTALTDVREAIGGYRSKGLAAEMEQARETLTAAGVALSFESPIPRLNPAEETVLALAVREAVTNIVRHARAQHCRMTFQTTDDGFHSLCVEDDGTGIAGSAQLYGNGLRGMRERVQSLGGRVTIRNANHNLETPGTSLIIELPTVPVALLATSCVNA